MATTVPKLFNGLPSGLTQGEYRLFSVTLGLLQDWTAVSLTAFGTGAYQAQIPLPSGFVQGYIISRAPGDPTTESYPEEIGTAVFVPSLPSAPTLTGMNNVGVALARQRENFVAKQGTAVTLPGGSIRPAMVHHSDHELLRSLRDDGDAPEKRPVVFVFGGSAWGAVTEGAKLTVGSGNMVRSFIVGDPLHPKWRQGIITEVAVVAFPV